MALASITAAYTQLNANLLWEGDAAKAALFIEAARYMLFNRAHTTREGISMNWPEIQNQLEQAEAWYHTVGRRTERASMVKGTPV